MKNGWRGWQAAGLGVAAALCMAQAGAQQSQSVAALKDLTGNVLVSREAGLATGSEAQRLANGTRVITTAKSGVVVVFDNGCEVRLRENERLDVDSGKPCALLVAQPLGPMPPVAAVGAPLLGVLLPGAVGAGLVVDIRDKQPVSPN